MKKYEVTFTDYDFDAKIPCMAWFDSVTVKAETKDEAKELALQKFDDGDVDVYYKLGKIDSITNQIDDDGWVEVEDVKLIKPHFESGLSNLGTASVNLSKRKKGKR